MSPSKIKIEFCTSCGSQEIKVIGNNYYCSACDVTFKVTSQGTKVIDTNPLGKDRSRIDALEDDVAQLKGGEKPGLELANATDPSKVEPVEPVEPAADDEDEDEQDGFISIEP